MLTTVKVLAAAQEAKTARVTVVVRLACMARDSRSDVRSAIEDCESVALLSVQTQSLYTV